MRPNYRSGMGVLRDCQFLWGEFLSGDVGGGLAVSSLCIRDKGAGEGGGGATICNHSQSIQFVVQGTCRAALAAAHSRSLFSTRCTGEKHGRGRSPLHSCQSSMLFFCWKRRKQSAQRKTLARQLSPNKTDAQAEDTQAGPQTRSYTRKAHLSQTAKQRNSQAGRKRGREKG